VPDDTQTLTSELQSPEVVSFPPTLQNMAGSGRHATNKTQKQSPGVLGGCGHVLDFIDTITERDDSDPTSARAILIDVIEAGRRGDDEAELWRAPHQLLADEMTESDDEYIAILYYLLQVSLAERPLYNAPKLVQHEPHLVRHHSRVRHDDAHTT
jgi:hypothetical protein